LAWRLCLAINDFFANLCYLLTGTFLLISLSKLSLRLGYRSVPTLTYQTGEFLTTPL
jgi:hypothetical protein